MDRKRFGEKVGEVVSSLPRRRCNGVCKNSLSAVLRSSCVLVWSLAGSRMLAAEVGRRTKDEGRKRKTLG